MEEFRNIKSNRALIPLWQTPSLKNNVVPFRLCSDQGCSGLDINVGSNEEALDDSCVDVITIKEQTNKQSLCARECCSPFLPPNEESDLKDPCLAAIEADRTKELHFISNIISNWKRKHKSIECLKPIWTKLKDETLRDTLLDETVTLNTKILDIMKLFPSSFPVEKANWIYTGNGLSATNEKILIHSGGTNTSDLVVTPLAENNDGGFMFSGEKKQVVRLKGGPILGISSKQVMDTDLCLIRKKRCIKIFQIADQEAILVGKHKTKLNLSSASLNPHIVGDYVLLNAEGDLELHSFTHSVAISHVKVSHSKESQSDTGQHWVCDFGAHPRGLLYMDRKKLTSLDLRGMNRKTTQIFQSKNQYLLDSEQLFMFQQSITNPFQYFLSTTHQLLVADERFPNIPVQLWKHQLSSFPILLWQGAYPDPNQSANNMLVLLACQRPQETSCFQVHPKSPQPISISPPWLCSGLQDPCKVLKHYGLPVPDVYQNRSAFPVIGICSVSHTQGASIFHQTSLGDLYCQDFFFPNGMDCERTHHFGPGYTPPLADGLSLRLQDWVQNVQSPEEQEMDLPCFEWTKPCSFFDGCLENMPAPGNCRFCVPDELQTEKQNQTEMTEKCPYCQLSGETASEICQGVGKLDVLAKGEPVKNNPSKSDVQWLFYLTNLRRDFDPFTLSLLKEWNVSDMEIDPDPETEVEPLSYVEPVLHEPKTTPNRTDDNSSVLTKSDSCVPDFDFKVPVLDSVSKQDSSSLLRLCADDDTEKSSLKRGSPELSDDDENNDFIPPSQNYEEQRMALPSKRLSYLQDRKFYNAGF